MSIDQKIIEKIQKLINLRDGAEAIGNIHEAENAALRLQEFLMKYNLDEATVKHETIEKKAEMDAVFFSCSENSDKRESDWVWSLVYGVAKGNLCEIVSYGKGETVRIIGHKMNVALVSYIIEQLIAKIRLIEKMAWNNYAGEEKRGTFRRGFFKGAAIGVGMKLREARNEYGNFDNPYAVMVVSKEAEVKEEMYRLYPHLRPLPPSDTAEEKPKKKVKPRKPRKGLSSQDGFFQGFEAGKKLEVNKGVEDNQAKTYLS